MTSYCNGVAEILAFDRAVQEFESRGVQVHYTCFGELYIHDVTRTHHTDGGSLICSFFVEEFLGGFHYPCRKSFDVSRSFRCSTRLILRASQIVRVSIP
jgi:hypothetical protein